MELEVLITHHFANNCTCGCYYGNCFVPTTADTIAESMRLYYCLWNCFGYWNNNDAAPTVATRLLLRLPKEPAVFEFSLSNPSAVDTTYLTFTNGTAEVLITLPLRKQ
jgi:hypothetical protein